MTLQEVMATIFFLIGVGGLIRANVVFGEITAAINRLEPKEQANFYGFQRHRFFDVLADYRRLYPEGKLISRVFLWAGIGSSWVLVATVYCLVYGVGSSGYVPRHHP
jgi:hypothetical protein